MDPVQRLLRDPKNFGKASLAEARRPGDGDGYRRLMENLSKSKPSPVKYKDSLKEFTYFSKQFEGMSEKEFTPNEHLGMSDDSLEEFPYDFD